MELQLKDLSHIITPFTGLEHITALAVGGSYADGTADDYSDVDIYIYSDSEIPENSGKRIALDFGEDIEIGQRYRERCDEWTDRLTGRRIDIIYRNPEWMVGEIRRILVDYDVRLGCTTCSWDNLLHSTLAYDPAGWYSDLRKTALVPYPFRLRDAIIKHNHPVLRTIRSSYLNQMKKAIERSDIININSIISSLIISFFEIVFAINRTTHPSNKRLLYFMKKRCKKIPENSENLLKDLLYAPFSEPYKIIESAENLIDSLDFLLKSENLFPSQNAGNTDFSY